MTLHTVIPAKAGIQRAFDKAQCGGDSDWIPAFAGMTDTAHPIRRPTHTTRPTISTDAGSQSGQLG